MNGLRRLARRSETDIDDRFIDALENPTRFAFLVFGLYVATNILSTSVETGDWMDVMIRSLIVLTLFWALFRLIGTAAALGAKDMIANVFGGAMIFLNRLFDRGNWIKTPDLEGVVEEIGLIATNVRRFDKALVTVPNSQLTTGPIVNFSRMTNRRIYWKIGVEYRTT